MHIAENMTQLIGRTPLVALSGLTADRACGARLLAKVESFNPGGSAKDRIALAMLDDAEARGLRRIRSSSSRRAAIPAWDLPWWPLCADTARFLPCRNP